MIYLRIRKRFSAAHKLYNEDWSVEKNKSVYGKCANPNFHGHNYVLFITVVGNVDPAYGFVMNKVDIDEIVGKAIIDKLDHYNLNVDVDFLKGQRTTVENIAKAIWRELDPLITTGKLHCIELHETENIAAFYYGN